MFAVIQLLQSCEIMELHYTGLCHIIDKGLFNIPKDPIIIYNFYIFVNLYILFSVSNHYKVSKPQRHETLFLIEKL